MMSKFLYITFFFLLTNLVSVGQVHYQVKRVFDDLSIKNEEVLQKVSPRKAPKAKVKLDVRVCSEESCYQNKFADSLYVKVDDYLQFFQSTNWKSTSLAMGIAEHYDLTIEEELGKEGLPNCLKYLPYVLSAMDKTYEGDNMRVGLWQLTYPVAVKYGLTVNEIIDERRDVRKSSMAAAKYFKDLYNMYHDHYVTIAAFCLDPASINKAQNRSEGSTYSDLYPHLKDGKRDFVLAYMAINYLMKQEHSLTPIEVKKAGEFDAITLPKRLYLKSISQVLDIELILLKSINPIYRGDFVEETSYPYNLPAGYGEKFVKFQDSIIYINDSVLLKVQPIPKPKPRVYKIPSGSEKVIYKVRSGDYLGKIAKRYGVKVSQIKGWNNLRSDRIDIGQKLKIYAADKPAATATTTTTKEQPKETTATKTTDGKAVIYTIKSGDTLWGISQKYDGVSADEIQKWNNIKDPGDIRPGQQLKIYSK